MGIPLVSGTDFAPVDELNIAPQAIVNEAFVSQFLDGGTPIGRRVTARARNYTIAGVVGNSTINTFGESAVPMIYFSYRDAPLAAGEIHLRTQPGLETQLGQALREAVRQLDPEVPCSTSAP